MTSRKAAPPTKSAMAARRPERPAISIRKSSRTWLTTIVLFWATVSRAKLQAIVNTRVLVLAVTLSLLGGSMSLGFAASVPPTSSTAKQTKKNSARTKTARHTKKKKRKKVSRRVRRITRAFVASTDLKPMARQLLQDRTPAAYAGVQAYARRHAGTDEAALAWLAIGYAHLLEHDYAKAVPALKRAQPRAGELADYVDYFLAMAYGAQGDSADVVKALGKFESNYPDSLFAVDAAVIYANALVAQNQ